MTTWGQSQMLGSALSILATIGLVVGPLAGGAAIWFWRYERDLMNLPTVPGTILASEVREVIADTWRPSSALSGKTHRLELQVRYQYQVDGIAHTGTRLSNWSQHETIDLITGMNKSLRELTARFAAGNVVPVHYRPDRPEISWLYIDRFGTRLFVPFSAVLVSVGVVSMIFKWSLRIT